jgi:hypothetical protein
MMNIGPTEARALSLWEYEALLHHWNEAHSAGDDVKAPDHDKTQKLIDMINLDPKLYQGKPKPNPPTGRA